MRPGDRILADTLEQKLISFTIPLPGIDSLGVRTCFVRQLIDSIRRIKYISEICKRNFSSYVIDTSKADFDPLKAAVWNKNQNNFDEAFWLLFLSTHFGKNKKTGWKLIRNVYGGLEKSKPWDWQRVSSSPEDFLYWLDDNQEELKASGHFGNHRKYESLNAFGSRGTGAAITSYVDWVGSSRKHQQVISKMQTEVDNNPRVLFNYLYKSMDTIATFGRTAKFDYLTMLGKFELAPIEPDSTYMQGATGPLRGARLLFDGNITSTLKRTDIEYLLNQLEVHLNLYFGMQVLEDALCNWQKSPAKYVYFGG